MESVGLDNFRARIHALAQYARQQLVNFAHQQCIVPDSPAWYGGMAHVPLPPGNREKLQAALWAEYQIEAPIVEFAGSRFIRVSCHLYNTTKQIDYLASSLATLLRDE